MSGIDAAVFDVPAYYAAAPGLVKIASRKSSPPPVNITPIAPPAPPIERYGNWQVTIYRSFYLASNVNESGSFFGVACSSTCFTMFNPVIDCDDNAEYPALVNASAGAYSVNLRCVSMDGRKLLTTTLDKDLLDSMEIGGELGIAFPMKGGKFQVSRFSLTGALKATIRAFDLSEASAKESGEKGLRDQTL